MKQQIFEDVGIRHPPVDRPDQGQPFNPHTDAIRGFVYDVHSWKLNEVR